MRIKPVKYIEGEIAVPPDKSITHRAVMAGAIAYGKTRIRNFLKSDDTLYTLNAFKALGVKIGPADNGDLLIEGSGLAGLTAPAAPIYVGESGTTMRLLAGILAGGNFECTLTGKGRLLARPMARIIEPLLLMGADIKGVRADNFAPLMIKGSKLKPITYSLPVPSAQVKSCILFAGLYADGVTTVRERIKTRDHTERMLRRFGADLSADKEEVRVTGVAHLNGAALDIPGDISSAAFLIVGALITGNSRITIKEVGVNPTRVGFLDILKDMGANIRVENLRGDEFEPRADITAESSALAGAKIGKSEIPGCIDELPILMVAASLAKGRSVIEGASELRVKETDRINSMACNLKGMGAGIEVRGDDIIIEGKEALKGASLSGFGDHRSAMSAYVAALAADGPSEIDDITCIDKSFPEFLATLNSITK